MYFVVRLSLLWVMCVSLFVVSVGSVVFGVDGRLRLKLSFSVLNCVLLSVGSDDVVGGWFVWLVGVVVFGF